MARQAGSSARTCSDDHPESIHNALRAAAGASQKSIPGSLRTSSQELRPFPQDISIMTEAQLDAALAKGYEDLKEFQFYSYVLEMMLQVFRSIFKCHRCKKSSEDELKAIKTKNDSGAVSYENIRIFNGSLRWYSATPI